MNHDSQQGGYENGKQGNSMKLPSIHGSQGRVSSEIRDQVGSNMQSGKDIIKDFSQPEDELFRFEEGVATPK